MGTADDGGGTVTIEDFLYRLGEAVESATSTVWRCLREILAPSVQEEPPVFSFLRRFVKGMTPHEYLSLSLQLVLLGYLAVNLTFLLIRANPLLLVLAGGAYFLLLRFIFGKYGNFFIDPLPYRVFYYGIGAISFGAFLGYGLLRAITGEVTYYYVYLFGVLLVVLAFRWYFKGRYGRDHTYGIVEDVKNNLVRVFAHDDIAANVKPGYYWVEKVPEAEPGRIVKLLVEDRKLRGAIPVRIIEVYLPQSSHTKTNPKEDAE